MKITIDTKEDSHDEIRKVIKLLQTMIEQTHNADIFSSASKLSDDQEKPASTSLFDMFGNDNSDDNTPLKEDEKAEENDLESDMPEEPSPEVQLY